MLKEYNLNLAWTNSTIDNHEYNIDITNELPKEQFDAVILAVSHKEFADIDVKKLVKKDNVIFDVKGFLGKDVVDGRL